MLKEHKAQIKKFATLLEDAGENGKWQDFDNHYLNALNYLKSLKTNNVLGEFEANLFRSYFEKIYRDIKKEHGIDMAVPDVSSDLYLPAEFLQGRNLSELGTDMGAFFETLN